MTIAIGDKAPTFSLFSSDQKKVNLTDFEGQSVLILFFPMAFTGVCTSELCSLRDSLADYESLNTQILAISVNSVFTLAKFKEIENLNFPLLSDYNKEVCRAFGAIHEEFAFGMKKVAKRSAFVIDHEGVIQYAEVLDNPTLLPSFDNIKLTLEKL